MALMRGKGKSIKWKETETQLLDSDEDRRPNGRRRAVRFFHGSDGRTYHGKAAKARVKLENRRIAEADYLKGSSTMEKRSRTMPGSMQIRG